METASLLTAVLNAVETAALTGFGLIEADAESLAWMIAKVSGFAVLLSALIAPREFSVSQPVALIITLYVIGFLMAYFQPITQSLLEMMERVGLAAGGNTVNLTSLKDVSTVAHGGWTGAGPLIHALKDKLGWDFYNYIHYIFFYLVCITLILVIHIVLAYRIFFLYLEYFVISTVAYFLLPTAAWGRTAYLAERAIGYVVSVGISLLLMGFLYSLVHQYVASIEWDADMKLIDMVSATTATVVLVMAVILAGRAVRALQQGAPTMSASYAFHQIAGAAGQMWMAAHLGAPYAAHAIRGITGLGGGIAGRGMRQRGRSEPPSASGSAPPSPEAAMEARRRKFREVMLRDFEAAKNRPFEKWRGPK